MRAALVLPVSSSRKQAMSIITLIKIQYVGAKPFAIDNVAGTRKIWNGNGDIQEVNDRAARVLLKYPDQWALANPDDQAMVDTPEMVQARDEDGNLVDLTADELSRPIERMTKVELVALAKRKWNRDLDIDQTKKVLLDSIEELMRANGELV